MAALTFGQITTLSGRRADGSVVDRLAQKRRSGGLLSDRINRKQFLRLASAAGVGVGLAVLGWLPPMRSAHAGHTTYSIWSTCPFDYGSAPPCQACFGNASSQFCAPNGWHRHDTSGGYDYRVDVDECQGRNAWKWTTLGVFCCNGRWGRKYRCSDGQRRPAGCTSCAWRNTTCPWQIGSGTAC
jgi:hypothetical protein